MITKISAGADWGPRPGSAHVRCSAQPPIDTSENCSADMSGRVGKKDNSKHFSFFSKKKPYKIDPLEGRGGPPIILLPQILFFL